MCQTGLQNKRKPRYRFECLCTVCVVCVVCVVCCWVQIRYAANLLLIDAVFANIF